MYPRTTVRLMGLGSKSRRHGTSVTRGVLDGLLRFVAGMPVPDDPRYEMAIDYYESPTVGCTITVLLDRRQHDAVTAIIGEVGRREG